MNTTNELPWVKHLRDHIGLKEIKGKETNPTIASWLKEMGNFANAQKAWWADDETPWCGLAVGYALGVSGRYVVPSWYRAKDWMNSNMTQLIKPAYGCIAIKSRKGGGHVFFVVGKAKNGNLLGLGGNQGNKITIAEFAPSEVDAYYWPSYWKDGKAVKSRPHAYRTDLPIGKSMARKGVSEA